MGKRSRTPLCYRLIGWFISFLFLLSLISPVGLVQADNKTGFVITSLSVAEPEICIGQKVSVFGDYEFNLDPALPLVPLAGPDVIKTHAGVGTTGPQNLYPGVPSGSFEFDYQGVKVGTDQITAGIIYAGKTVDEKSVSINVTQKCVYSYRFIAYQDSFVTQPDESYTIRNTITASGKLVTDPSASITQLTGTTRIELVTDILNFKPPPDCQLFTWSPGYAEGSADVTADISGGLLVKFKIGGPKNFEYLIHVAGECNGAPSSGSAEIDLSPYLQIDPFLEHDFLPEGGTEQIKVDYLDQITRNCYKGGMSCNYDAWLILTREKGE